MHAAEIARLAVFLAALVLTLSFVTYRSRRTRR